MEQEYKKKNTFWRNWGGCIYSRGLLFRELGWPIW